MADVDELEKQFQRCCTFIEKRGDSLKLNDSDKLKFYGLFKQVHSGPCSVPSPSFWDIRGKAKWSSWKELGDLSREDAMKEYTRLFLSFVPPSSVLKEGEEEEEESDDEDDDEGDDDDEEDSDDEDEDESKKKSRSGGSGGGGMGPVFSRFVFEEEKKETDPNDPWALAKEGNIERLQTLLETKKELLSLTNEEGMTILHVASDTEQYQVVKWAIENGAEINKRDENGQTSLYVASCCDYLSVVELLLSFGADVSIPDLDGELPLDATSDSAIRQLLAKKTTA